MAKLNLSVMVKHDLAVWRNGILKHCLTRALRGKMKLNDNDLEIFGQLLNQSNNATIFILQILFTDTH
jgi:hypothetical protein